MAPFIPWNSQPLDAWADKYAQGQFVDLAGRRTHYIEQGAGEPVLLLHGFFYDAYIWAANIDALAEHFKVYALDLWGFGYSTRAPLDYGYPLYAEQVLRFMDHLGLERASLVGQSLGGGTAISFCVGHRSRVNKLLLVDPAGLPNPLPFTEKIFNFPHVGEFLMGLNTNAIRRKTLGDYWIHTRALITDRYFENVTRFQKINQTTEALLAVLRKRFFDTLSQEIQQLGQMDVPILLVWGRQDKAVPLRLGQEMHRILPGSRLEILDNAGHVPNYECAAAFNQLAVDFLVSSQ
ncbi:MAG: alpha/beta fold hydrolase [Anaerolineaceae bacterium]|nr:alpha/beta fold hydrolase [Anaerolineaceae bacterium]MCB9101265.1 alpha/beta fold hydrolase [Anaerolineales bacterium]